MITDERAYWLDRIEEDFPVLFRRAYIVDIADELFAPLYGFFVLLERINVKLRIRCVQIDEVVANDRLFRLLFHSMDDTADSKIAAHFDYITDLGEAMRDVVDVWYEKGVMYGGDL